MRRAKLGVLTAVGLVLGAAGLSASAQTVDGDLSTAPRPKPSILWSGWGPGGFGGKGRSAVPPQKLAPAAAVPAAPVPVPVTVDREREQNAFWRRLAVCQKLKEIAVLNNDVALERQVEQLEQQVFEVYQQRLGMASGRGTRPSLDERVLEERLGRAGGGGDLMTRPGRSQPDAGRTASLREGR
jgi:hypothetical protein